MVSLSVLIFYKFSASKSSNYFLVYDSFNHPSLSNNWKSYYTKELRFNILSCWNRHIITKVLKN